MSSEWNKTKWEENSLPLPQCKSTWLSNISGWMDEPITSLAFWHWDPLGGKGFSQEPHLQLSLREHSSQVLDEENGDLLLNSDTWQT